MAYDQVLAARIRERLHGETGVVEKAMFGGLAFLVRGHMAVAASGQGGLMVRCNPDATEQLTAEPHAERFVMRGRPMTGWLRVDAAGVDSEAQLARWVTVGVDHVRTLPPK